jgi:signal transduction histidine kinase
VRLTQVFPNLLVSVSKCMDGFGEIVISASPAAESIVVTIEDNGTGISPKS